MIKQAETIIADIEAALDIVVALAGIEAEARLCPELCARKYATVLARGVIPSDFTRIRGLLSGYRQADIDLVMPALMFGCSMLVGANWPKIEALAEALLANGVVKRHEIMRLLGRRTTPMREAVMMVAWLIAGARLAGSARMCQVQPLPGRAPLWSWPRGPPSRRRTAWSSCFAAGRPTKRSPTPSTTKAANFFTLLCLQPDPD